MNLTAATYRVNVMNYAKIIACFMALSACQTPSTNPADAGLITLQITGNDGAASGEIGRAILTADGNLTCELDWSEMAGTYYDDDGTAIAVVPFDPAEHKTTQTFLAPEAYAKIAQLIRDNASPPGSVVTGDYMRLGGTGNTTVVSASAIFGLADPVASAASTILNAETGGQCWQWG